MMELSQNSESGQTKISVLPLSGVCNKSSSLFFYKAETLYKYGLHTNESKALLVFHIQVGMEWRVYQG